MKQLTQKYTKRLSISENRGRNTLPIVENAQAISTIKMHNVLDG